MRVNIEDLNTDKTVTHTVSETSANGKGRVRDTTNMSFNSIHFDHVYTSFDREPDSKTVRDLEPCSSSTVLADFRYKDKMLVPDWKSSCAYYRNFKSSSNTSCAEFSGYNSRGRPKNSDPEISALNAETIQQVFQDMINMTSLTPVSDVDNVAGGTADDKKSDRLLEKREVKVVDALPYLTKNVKSKSSSNSKIDDKAEDSCKDKGADKTKAKNKHELQKGKEVVHTPKTQQNTKTPGSICKSHSARTLHNKCKEVDKAVWRATARFYAAEQELNTLLRFTADLLVRRWGQYLSMTAEQVAKFELENAKEVGLAQEVIEMLEDKDRYVWQLIDELEFF